MKIKKNKMVEGKCCSKIIFAGVILLCGVVTVLADSRAAGGLVNLSNGGTASMTMEDCTYDYFFGSAIATNQPSTGTSLTWKMKTTGLFAKTVKTDYIVSLSTTQYSHTTSWLYPKDDTYKFTFTANNGGYYGNVQTTNQTTQAILF